MLDRMVVGRDTPSMVGDAVPGDGPAGIKDYVCKCGYGTAARVPPKHCGRTMKPARLVKKKDTAPRRAAP